MGNQKKCKVDNVTIAYLGGGSLGWAHILITDLAMEEQISGSVRLYDIDYDAACQNAAIGNNVTAMPASKGKWSYTATKSIEEALEGADFVIASILPGTFKEMHADVHTPEKYGVYQSVGDTVGPGGIIRSLRTIPIYRDFALKIKERAPDAWVINYTNPMSVCVRTLYETFPQIKAFGCCHEVFGTQDLLASLLSKLRGINGVARHDIKMNVLGINHFTWVDKMSYLDTDLMPLYSEAVGKFSESGYKHHENNDPELSVFRDSNIVKFDLFKRYGLVAAAGDRHLAEFMPPSYLESPQTVKDFGFALTPVDYRIESRKKLVKRRSALVSGEEKITLAPTGEEGMQIIKALLGLSDYVTNVNLPNSTQMDNIPSHAIVETNALFSRDCIRPLEAGKLPDDIQNMVVRHVYNQECVVKAGLERDKPLAFNAFINDPLMAKVSLTDAKMLFDEMLESTKLYLQEWE